MGSSRHSTIFGSDRSNSAPVKLDRYMPRAEESGCFGRVRQLVIFERLSVADGVSRPGPALFVHQRQEQARVKPAAKKYSNRNIAQEMASHGAAIQFKQFLVRLLHLLSDSKMEPACSYTSVLRGISLFSATSIVPGASFRIPWKIVRGEGV